MAINFFNPDCIRNTNEPFFGLVDLPPATISLDNETNWNAEIDNSAQSFTITLTAIDGCIEIPRAEGERCEAMITYDNAIMFIELKDRDSGRWAGKARDQLENSIRLYDRDADLGVFTRKYAHIANKRRPYFKSGGSSFFQEFEDRTDFVLRVSYEIKIT